MNIPFETPIPAEESLNSAIPSELLARQQWLAWWSVVGEGRPAKLPNGRRSGPLKKQKKPHKLPINPQTGGLAASTRPTTWSSAEIARAATNRWALSGIGFVFTESDPYSGVDIDNCRNPETGEIADWAWMIVRALDSYTEVSPSGTGVHTIVRGKLPAGLGNQVAVHDGKVEMFSRARYFTFTGIPVHGTPTDIFDRQSELLALHNELFGSRNSRDFEGGSTWSSPLLAGDDELITNARKAQNGSKFERLWNGQWEGDYPSQSEADLALCCLLAFWTGKDRARISALFRLSGLMRKKWLNANYSDATISRAIECTGQTWTPGGEMGRSRSGLDELSNQRRAGARTTRGGAIWEPPVPFHHSDLPTFPTEALPGWLRAFVEAEARATQTPADLAAMLTLSVVAASCAKKVVVCIKEGYVEPVNLFTVTALPPGSRKTTVFKTVTAPLEDQERAEARRTARAISEAQVARAIKETKLKKLHEQAINATEKDQEKFIQEAATLAADLADTPPATPTRYLADDCTPEKLVTLLREQGGRIAVMSPEGDVFDLLAGRYSTNGMGNFGVYLKGHAGDTLRIDRVGRPAEFVKEPALTVGLAVQPDVIRGLAEKPGFRGRGLLARFLYSLPDSLLGRRDTNTAPVADHVRASYYKNILLLLRIPFGMDENGEPHANVLNLDPGARESIQQFEAWVEPQLSEFGELGGIADWAGKIVGTVGRIAANLHLANLAGATPWETLIPKETIEKAIRIGKYLIPHAKAAFAEMGADKVVEQAKAILRWLQHQSLDSFTKRELHQSLRGRFKRVAELDLPLSLLLNHGFIRMGPDASTGGPGRPPSHTYDVNPLWASQSSESAADSASRINFENCEDSEAPGRPTHTHLARGAE